MRILILGAGGTGGYFGGRLAQAGCDVRFLVRPARAVRLRERGLVIRSPLGDATLPVEVVEPAQLRADHDLVILSCKAYDLDDAIRSVRPAMQRSGTMLLPLLNGIAHYAGLDAAFGAEAVLGGLCHISATLNAAGEIEHLSRQASVTFGERDAARVQGDDRCARIADAFRPAAFEARHSADIHVDMWEKYSFLAAAAAVTCLMRASVGDIVRTPEGERITRQLIAECEGIARAEGFPTSARAQQFRESMLTAQGSQFKASMLRDVEAGHRVEADHLLGELLRRGRAAGQPVTLLEAAYAQLKAYEQAR